MLGQKGEKKRGGAPTGAPVERVSGDKTEPAQQNKGDIDDNGTRTLWGDVSGGVERVQGWLKSWQRGERRRERRRSAEFSGLGSGDTCEFHIFPI